eukprot:TRINITY_DN4146_c0_g1_i3.p1 TRINITY_DN4146_c0_g1~~TRINITY_DN4146_c0_g1_i3.p1  ORF type:complete len:559 (-),score=114.61 TRINITY_DN4146_c0_g1_i3:1050-2726(-)
MKNRISQLLITEHIMDLDLSFHPQDYHEALAREDVQRLWPIIKNLIEMDGGAEQIMDNLVLQTETIIQLEDTTQVVNENVQRAVITLSKVLKDKSAFKTKLFTISSTGVGVGVGVLAGMAGGPIGMIIGGVVGGPLFGLLGFSGGKLLTKKMRSNGNQAIVSAIEDNWEKWKKNQACYQCDRKLRTSTLRNNGRHCRNCGFLFCYSCTPREHTIKIDSQTLNNVPICLNCESIIEPDIVHDHDLGDFSGVHNYIEGILYKLPVDGFSMSLLRWKKRKVTLDVNKKEIAYYRKDELMGKIDLEKATDIYIDRNESHNSNAFGFAIEITEDPQEPKIINFSTTSHSNRRRWLTHINEVIHINSMNNWEENRENFINNDIVYIIGEMECTLMRKIKANLSSKLIFKRNGMFLENKNGNYFLGEYQDLIFDSETFFSDHIIILNKDTKSSYRMKFVDVDMAMLLFNYFSKHPYTTLLEYSDQFGIETGELSNNIEGSSNIDTMFQNEAVGPYEVLSNSNLFDTEHITLDDVEWLSGKTYEELVKIIDEAMLYKNKEMVKKVD